MTDVASYRLLTVRGPLVEGRTVQIAAGDIAPDIDEVVLVKSATTGEYRTGVVAAYEKRDRTERGDKWSRRVVATVELGPAWPYAS